MIFGHLLVFHWHASAILVGESNSALTSAMNGVFARKYHTLLVFVEALIDVMVAGWSIREILAAHFVYLAVIWSSALAFVDIRDFIQLTHFIIIAGLW